MSARVAGAQGEGPAPIGVELAGIRFKNPVWVGSSELTMSLEGISDCVEAGAGAVVAKSINENPAAARQLDIADYVFVDADRAALPAGRRDASLLNRSGLAQTRLDDWLRMLEEAQRRAERRGSAVIGSITVSTAEGAARIGSRLREVVPALELNIGAPHGREAAGGAVRQLSESDATGELVASVSAAVPGPLIVKLPAGVHGIPDLAIAAQRGGADVVAMTGRFNGFLPDLRDDAPLLGSWGAYSGPWALPMSLYEVSKTFRRDELSVPIVGTNGARSAEDVLRFILSGASAVELVTAVWTEGAPVITEIVDGLERLLEERNAGVAELVGVAAAQARSYAEIVPDGPRPEPWRR